MSSLFDSIKIEERLKELQGMPPFKPDEHEPRFTVTQLFEDGIECTLFFVIRDGHPLFYDSKQTRITQPV